MRLFDCYSYTYWRIVELEGPLSIGGPVPWKDFGLIDEGFPIARIRSGSDPVAGIITAGWCPRIAHVRLFREDGKGDQIPCDVFQQGRNLAFIAFVERQLARRRSVDQGAEYTSALEDIAHKGMVFEVDQRQ